MKNLKDLSWLSVQTYVTGALIMGYLIFVQFTEWESPRSYWFATILSIASLIFLIWQDRYFSNRAKELTARMEKFSLSIKLLDVLISYRTKVNDIHRRSLVALELGNDNCTVLGIEDLKKIISLTKSLSEWSDAENVKLEKFEKLIKSDLTKAQDYNNPPDYSKGEYICEQIEAIVGIDDTLDAKIIS